MYLRLVNDILVKMRKRISEIMKLQISAIFLVGAGITFSLSTFNENLNILTLVYLVLSLINFIQYKSKEKGQ